MPLTNVLTPARHELGERVWQAAGVLAGLRRATNEPIRSGSRDRGPATNIENDILGALTELVALRASQAIPGAEAEHSLLSLGGPVAGEPDLVLRRRRELRLETKGHFLDPRKKLLAINERAHGRSRERGAEGYIPIISRLGAKAAVSGRIIPVADVDDWQAQNLGQHKDRALTATLTAVSETYFDSPLDGVAQAVGDAEGALRTTVLRAEQIASGSLERARATNLALPTRFDEVVEALTRFVGGER